MGRQHLWVREGGRAYLQDAKPACLPWWPARPARLQHPLPPSPSHTHQPVPLPRSFMTKCQAFVRDAVKPHLTDLKLILKVCGHGRRLGDA